MGEPRRVVIMGAAGRDFHNFNTFYRNNPDFRVIAFTAFQIPNIAGRTYPPELAGELYPDGIPIFPEEELTDLVREQQVDDVVFSYSDVSYTDVMRRSALANAAGADFRLMGTRSTTLPSEKPVVSVCAVRTGCGKSQTSRRVAELLRAKGRKVVVVRHPMPYGDLAAQRCQRFETLADMDRHECTIEEREEYEKHVDLGHVVYAGVDYEQILRQAEAEADIVLWDGGNNDLPFYRSDLHIVLVDPHRPGHEENYYPGEANLRIADVALINKVGTAPAKGLEAVRRSVARINPSARVIEANSVVTVDNPDAVRGKRVLVVEDGPTLTHGEMTYGAAHVAARQYGAAEIVDPRPYAVGSIKETYAKYPHVTDVLPAMGYGDRQTAELKETIDSVPCDVVLVGTPFDLGRLIETERPLERVTYQVDEQATQVLDALLDEFLAR